MVLVASSLSATAAWVPQRPSFVANKHAATALYGKRRMRRSTSSMKSNQEPELIPDGSDDSTGKSFAKFMEQSSPEDVIKEDEIAVNAPTSKSDPESQPFSKALQQTQLSEAEKELGLPEPVPVPDDAIPSETRSSLPGPSLTEEEKAAALPEPMKVEKIDVTASTGDAPTSEDIQANQLSEEERANALPEPTQFVVDPTIANRNVEDEFEPVSPELQATHISEEEKASALIEPLPTQEIDAPKAMKDEKKPISADLQAMPLTEEDKASALLEPTSTAVYSTLANAKLEDEFEPISPELKATSLSEEEKASALPEPSSAVVDDKIAHQPVENHDEHSPFSKALLGTQLTPEEIEEAQEAGAKLSAPPSEKLTGIPPKGPF